MTLVDHVRRQVGVLSWLNNPLSFTIASPLLTVLGAATSIAAPILLDPVSFGQFAILAGLYQYVSDFDLGLARLSDRTLTHDQIAVASAINVLLVARVCLAGTLCVVAIIASFVTTYLATLALAAGIAVVLLNGPISVYRAQSQIAQFTVASLGAQFGASLPRLAGLLIDGVRGCMVVSALWLGTTAFISYLPFVRNLHCVEMKKLRAIFAEALPLFVLSSSWLLYLLASRWFSWLTFDPFEASLFAFGANLVLVGAGVVNMVAQAYYPKHLAQPNSAALCRELIRLMVLALCGCLLADIFCRVELARVFPHFATADASTAAILFSGVPLSLNAWLNPLVIARSRRPIRDAVVTFGSSLVCLCLLMNLMGHSFGIIGQAWACTPPSLLLLTFQLRLLVRERLLDRAGVILVWTISLLAAGCSVGAWCLTFL